LALSIMYLLISYISCEENYNVDLWEEAGWSVEEQEFLNVYVPRYIEVIEQIAEQYDSDLLFAQSYEEGKLLVSLVKENIVILFEFNNETFYGSYCCQMYNFGADITSLIESSQYDAYFRIISDVNQAILFSSVGTYDSFTNILNNLNSNNNFSGYSYYNDSMIGSVGYSVRYSDNLEKHYKNLLEEAGYTNYNRRHLIFVCSGILDPNLEEL